LQGQVSALWERVPPLPNGSDTLGGEGDRPPWPWPWIRSYAIPSCISHRPLPTYQILFKSSNQKNCLCTDEHMNGHSDWLY